MSCRYRLTFNLVACVMLKASVVSVAQPPPATQSEAIQLGSRQVQLITRAWGGSDITCCNMHDDENTSVAAAEQVLAKRGGRLIELRHTGERNIVFRLGHSRYEFDPNRIFTSQGVSRTLAEFSRPDPAACDATEKFGQHLVRAYGGTKAAAMIALHNNRDGGFSAISYEPGGSLEREAAAVSDSVGSDPDDFFFVTDRRLYDALAVTRWRVVLQDNTRATDDGSLSVYCARHAIPYINVEAQEGHRTIQESMLSAALDAMNSLLEHGQPEAPMKPSDVDLVNLRDFDPTLVIDARYSTPDNITKRPLYPRNELFLERGAAERLRRVQAVLRRQGLGLKVLDAYRPLSVQKALWAVLPDPQYVADPAKGSRHNRGCAVDVTLVDRSGKELKMPTAFDEFSEKAHRDYQNLPQEVLRNRELLEQVMTAEQFEPLATEWWHFDAPGWERFPVMDRDPYAEGR